MSDTNIKITEVADPVKADSKFDPAKPVRTRDGREARIIATDVKHGTFSIAAVVWSAEGEVPQSFTADGRYFGGFEPDRRDLVNVPEQRVVDYWLNLYPCGAYERFVDKENAVFHRGYGAVTVHIQKTFNL